MPDADAFRVWAVNNLKQADDYMAGMRVPVSSLQLCQCWHARHCMQSQSALAEQATSPSGSMSMQACELFCTLIFLKVETLEQCLAMAEPALRSTMTKCDTVNSSKRLMYYTLWKVRQWLCVRASGGPVPVVAVCPDFDAEACLQDAAPLAAWLGLKQVRWACHSMGCCPSQHCSCVAGKLLVYACCSRTESTDARLYPQLPAGISMLPCS